MKRESARSGLDIVVRPARREASLWRRLRFEAEAVCREALFNLYVRLARAVALQHFQRRRTMRIERFDYEQFAYEGLLQAIDRFDPLRGAAFGAYARPRIAGSIADGIGRMSEVGAQLSQRRRVEQERVRSLGSGAQAPEDPLSSLSDLAIGLAVGLILQDARLLPAEDQVDPSPSAYDRLERRELEMRLAAAVEALPPKEALVIRQHYDNGLSFSHIARLLDVSRGRVSQLHAAGVQRLRRRIGGFR